MGDGLTIAVNKGRILKQLIPLFNKVGIVPLEDIETSRKLLFETRDGDVRLVIMRGSDVPVYVEQGAADLGITGKDTLLEYPGSAYYEKLDLGIAKCRIMTAAPVGRIARAKADGSVISSSEAALNAQTSMHRGSEGTLRVATKFVRIAQKYYAEQGIQVKLIKLSGAMEIAPLMNLADEIVDIVDTGNTLTANGLEPVNTICHVSSRVIVNRASMKLKLHQIQGLLERLGKACALDQVNVEGQA
ncbi:MAG: ATP phosphoribosyltransferase [Pseudomonadales bacterium]|nr:ATP phosphoribosyltransferase [Pseudomonadales bacterium]